MHGTEASDAGGGPHPGNTTAWAARVLVALAGDGAPVGFRARIVGGSMGVAVREGAWVRIEPCPPSALRAGELAAYGGPDGVVVHRVVRPLRDGVVVFRGDANRGLDAPTPAPWVLGRVCVETQPALVRWWLRRAGAFVRRAADGRRLASWAAGL